MLTFARYLGHSLVTLVGNWQMMKFLEKMKKKFLKIFVLKFVKSVWKKSRGEKNSYKKIQT